MRRSNPLTLLLALALLSISSSARPSPDSITESQPATKTLIALREIADLQEESVEQAILRLERLEASLDPNSIDNAYAKLARIQILLADDRFEEAIEPLQAAIDTQTLSPATQERAIRSLGQIYYQLDRSNDLLALFDQHFSGEENLEAETLQFYAIAQLQAGRSEQALESCARAIAKQDTPNATLYQISAAALQELERYSESARFIEALLELDPQDASLWDQIVAAHYRAGDLWAAYGAIQRAQKRGFKNDPATQTSEAEILYELEQYAVCAQFLENRIDQDDDIDKPTWMLLVYSYDQQNLSRQAIETLQRASKSTPWPEIDLQLADRHWKTKDYEATYNHIARASEKGPLAKPANAWTLATAAAIQLGRPSDAEQSLDKARKAGADPEKIARLEKSIKLLHERSTPSRS